MFLLQILLGVLIAFYFCSQVFPFYYFIIPKTIKYSILGEAKPYAVFLWFNKFNYDSIIFYFLIISFFIFPKLYINDFFCSYYFLISFLIVSIFLITKLFKDKQFKEIQNLKFEDYAIEYNFYNNYYSIMKSYNDSGNNKKDLFNDIEGAISDYTYAIKISQNYSSVYYNRGNAYLKIFDYENAIKDFDRAIELESHIYDYYDSRAMAKWNSGDLIGALKDFRISNEIAPDNLDTVINIHEILKKLDS